MPLLFSKKINPYSAYAVWKISETEDQLISLCHLEPPEMQSTKKSEWMVTRILTKYLLELFEMEFHGMKNLPTGKPVLIDQRAELSITHNFPFAATLINLRRPCGIDIELQREKLARVQHKFLHETELDNRNQLENLTKIWSAKEVIFKVHGEKNLSFKNEISVAMEGHEKGTGKILKDGHEQQVSLRYERVLDYWLCYSI